MVTKKNATAVTINYPPTVFKNSFKEASKMTPYFNSHIGVLSSVNIYVLYFILCNYF